MKLAHGAWIADSFALGYGSLCLGEGSISILDASQKLCENEAHRHSLPAVPCRLEFLQPLAADCHCLLWLAELEVDLG